MGKINVIVIGTGNITKGHFRNMFRQKRTTRVQALVEPSEASRKMMAAFFEENGQTCPPFYDSLKELLKNERQPDAALVATPHKFHFENVRDCMQAGMDVLVEKPMVLNASEAQRLIRVRDKTGRLLVVGFNGSLSAAVAKTKKLIAQGKIGEVSGISAAVYQNWKDRQTGTWRQIPEISGGGFLFDTGSHMINTVVDIAGSDLAEVSAIMDNRGAPVEINSSVSGRFRNGITFSLLGIGDSIHCTSRVLIMGDKGVIETGIWGEKLLLAKGESREFKPVPYQKNSSSWVQFVKVREGKIPNPCPPEIGLRFAKLMDMIRKSAETGERVVNRSRSR